MRRRSPTDAFVANATSLIVVAAHHQPPTQSVAVTLLDELAVLIDRGTRDGLGDALPVFAPGSRISGREASGSVLNALADVMPELVGGNIHFEVREHAMPAMCNAAW